jgi:hypothetical protein
MADWYGSARSNYFEVKDRERYVKFLEEYGLKIIEKEVVKMDPVCVECLHSNKVPQSCDHIVRRSVGACSGTTYKRQTVGFISESFDGGLPQYIEDDKGNVKEFDDFIDELAEHLADGWVAIMKEIGSEKLRYITGFSIAINNKKEKKIINLDEIYKESEELGSYITECYY